MRESSGLPAESALTVEQVHPLPFPLEPRDVWPHVAIVVPAFNEQEAVVHLYEGVRRVMEALPSTWSLLFVNDGSTDSTAAVLADLYERDERVSYVLLSRNFGHQSALAAGLDHADGDVIVMMDADLQHPPEVIPTLVEGWRLGYDVVHTQKRSTRELGRPRAVATSLAYRLIQSTASVEFLPQASDFRLVDGAVRDAIAGLTEHSRLYRGLSRWVGFRQAVVAFDAPRRIAGRSTYGLRQLTGLFARAFFDFSSAPLRVALYLGAATISLCLVYSVFVVGAFVFGQAVPPGYVSLLAAVAFVGSVNLILIGILGVYVARIYDEVRSRPSYLIAHRALRRSRTEE